jgi:threonyl-tRNA synthetase
MKKPQWPFWLSPTQIRICPVSEKFIDKATEIANQLNKARIRTDVDDRDNPLPKKVSNAESEWTPYILVLGEREITSGKLAIRTRETGKIENLSIEELIKKMKEEQGEMPWKPLAMQVLLTKRPIFVG